MVSIIHFITFALRFADVAKLVDAPDLGSGVAIREGSSPFIRTTPLVPRVYRFWGGPVLPSPRQSSFILV